MKGKGIEEEEVEVAVQSLRQKTDIYIYKVYDI